MGDLTTDNGPLSSVLLEHILRYYPEVDIKIPEFCNTSEFCTREISSETLIKRPAEDGTRNEETFKNDRGTEEVKKHSSQNGKEVEETLLDINCGDSDF